jgi:hypothetical protein
LVKLVVIAIGCATACSGDGAPKPTTAEPPRTAPPPPPTAARPRTPVVELPVTPPPPPSPSPTGGHTIDLTLRSSPSGARAAVDGVPVGNTPTHWSIDADGHEHEFTFDRPGYALARYRFVPVQSGVIHARLEPVAVEEPEPQTDVIAPGSEPSTPAPTAPPTVVSPATPRVGPQP